ncbi:hypothetical protein JTB14_025144 [Gonioctena quinquepunctata]|nr:hypothetical protein JTB14_025144 [Gonioctena quinquepunctata]
MLRESVEDTTETKFFPAHFGENGNFNGLPGVQDDDKLLPKTDKENNIQDKNTIIQMLQEKIDNLEKSQISYATAAAKPISPPPSQIIKNIPAIIIRPIIHQPAQTTKYDVQKAINPREINVPINSVNTTNDGKMVIKCATEEAT